MHLSEGLELSPEDLEVMMMNLNLCFKKKCFSTLNSTRTLFETNIRDSIVFLSWGIAFYFKKTTCLEQRISRDVKIATES